MINKLIEKYKQLVEENYDEDNCFADLSKAIVYQEIIQDLKKVKEPTICGHTVEEIITILNALDLERILDIKMTMENLQILSEKLQDDFKNALNKSIKNKELIVKYQKHRDWYKKEMEYAELKLNELDKYEFNELLRWECEKSFNKSGYLAMTRIIRDLEGGE